MPRSFDFVAPAAWMDVSTGTCPGYLVSLPQVIETARLHPWWEKGQLATRLEAQPSALLCDCLDVLEGAIGAVNAHVMRPRDE